MDRMMPIRSLVVPSILVLAALTVGFTWTSAALADEPADKPLSIIEQRRAIMRGEAAGRTKVEERKSSKSDLEKGDITFDDLKFDIEKDEAFDPEKLTDTLKFLNGRTVKLSGYILPSTLFKETDINEFVLVRDNQECCFGPGAALFDCVMIEMVGDKTTDFVTRPVTVKGKFVYDPTKYQYPPGVGPKGASHFAVFRIEGLQVK
ncbi:DUF3299 domain-containing protein [Allorhodopirellula solitaria]|uniref:DUF3299 domain-containing protein n=1 Tax=Allorhodopirellula solitaria TaxID=2527987 RepID=UPI0011B6EE2A|nr:DUF3299 domain-containing protein [Allorhodopirellula solitaria]